MFLCKNCHSTCTCLNGSSYGRCENCGAHGVCADCHSDAKVPPPGNDNPHDKRNMDATAHDDETALLDDAASETTTSAAGVRSFPLLFQAPMIRAFLANEKHETRRIMKPQPQMRDGALYWRHAKYDNGMGVHYFHTHDYSGVLNAWAKANPYGAIGDRMYARESVWRDSREPDNCVIYAATPEIARYKHDGRMIYATHATSSARDDGRVSRAEMQREMETNKFWDKRPSIFMPRWASRISARLVEVIPERLSFISMRGARAEGIPENATDALLLDLLDVEPHEWDNATSVENYKRLFYRLNEGAIAPNADPWLWVLRFAGFVVERPA